MKTPREIVHLGFVQDDRTRCGARSMSRSTSPAIVTCTKCLTIINTLPPAPPTENTLVLRVDLSPERRAVVGALANLFGKTVEEYLVGLIDRSIDELRLPL